MVGCHVETAVNGFDEVVADKADHRRHDGDEGQNIDVQFHER